jgi:pimeloyl-ACP methyl ester carboxylesterase
MNRQLDSVTMAPIAMTTGFGLLHRSSQSDGQTTGVVLCSAWGIHELSSRKMMFRLASALAAAGLATLRFDYPGTADALEAVGGFETWIAAASDAANRLKAACRLDNIVFAGLGIGATVAFLTAARRDDAAGLVLAAPVVSGRRYVREIALAAPVVEEVLGLQASQRPDGVSIGGIVMPPEVARDLKTVDLMTVKAGQPRPALVITRPGHDQETAIADLMDRTGWSTQRAAFEGFDAAMDNPTISVLPEAVIDSIARWCGELADRNASEMRNTDFERVVVESPCFSEEPIVFGSGLFGVLTSPGERTAAATVVFLNSGYDHHSGWAYQWTRTARALAAAGIASLRFDMGNIGDSAARRDVPEQVLYGESQQADVLAALDMLAERGESSVVLVGRCSGAYAAFHATARNLNVVAAVMINPLRMIWDPQEDVEVAIRIGPRSMADYRQRVMSGKVLKRLMDGDIDVGGAVKGVGVQLVRRVAQRLAPLAGTMSRIERLRKQCRTMMDAIDRRGTVMRFVCSERDSSLEQMAFYFGSDQRGLRRFSRASLITVPNADHNITPQPAHDRVVEVIRETALGFPAALRDNTAAQPDAETVAETFSEIELRARA